jgi:SAM-dependent methyltransferase
MSSLENSIYANPQYLDIDIGAIMRSGHPDIEDGDNRILDVLRQLRSDLGRPLRVLDVGSGSGHLSVLIARELSDCHVIANDVEIAPLQQARAKLAPFPNATVFDRSFSDWRETVDVVVSWGSHHHLSHDYLKHAHELLALDGLLLIGDELCPEYLTPSDQERLDAAQLVVIEDGYIFDNQTDLQSYRRNGVVPEWSRQLEEARRRALWTWYKFVGDYAVDRDAWMVLISELQIAHDDFRTKFAGEHKTSAYLLERELTLHDFRIVERKIIGNREPALQSFTLYSCRLAGTDSRTSGAPHV